MDDAGITFAYARSITSGYSDPACLFGVPDYVLRRTGAVHSPRIEARPGWAAGWRSAAVLRGGTPPVNAWSPRRAG